MPWTLRYPNDIDGRVMLNAHRARFAESGDVSNISVRRIPGPELVVSFWNEDRPTDSPELQRIHDQYAVPPFLNRTITGFRNLFDLRPNENQTTPDTREELIRRAIMTSEGRTRLAMPLRRSIDYSGTARRALLVEPLPEGALPVYDRGPQVAAFAVGGFLQAGEAFGAMIQSGFGAAVGEIQPGYRALITGLNGPVLHQVGHYLRLNGSPNPGNNGVFQIVEVVSPHSVWIANPAAQRDYSPGLQWEEFYPPSMLGGVDYAGDASLLAGSMLGNDMLGDCTSTGVPPVQEDRSKRVPAWTRILDDSFLSDD